MRCPQCASDNPPEYRFCGMCGTPLGKKEASVPEPVGVRREADRPNAAPPVTRIDRPEVSEPASRSDSVRTETAERPRAPEPPHRPEPVVSSLSGPSFLGLGSEPARGNGRSDSDVSYLLDDEEVQPRRTYWRFTMLLLIVVVIGGLVFLQYRKEGKSWTAPWANGPAQTPAQASQAPVTPPPAPNSGNTANQPSDNSAANTTPAGNATASNTPSNTDKQAASTTPTENNQANDTQTSKPADAGNKSDQATDSTGKTETAKASPPADTDNTTDTEAAAPAKPAKPAKPRAVREAAPATNPDDALVTNAEKYLYGRGVPQNCDRALSSLRSAAGRDNTRARTLLGTMYATGHCVPKDLPNAYRWFAQASRTSPDNMWVQRNLEMVWREMTPQERQLATKSQ